MQNTYFIILVSVLGVLALILLGSVLSQRKKIKHLEKQLGDLQGQSDKDLFGRGKFSELGIMSAGITHELSNPLSIIIGRVMQLLRKTQEPDTKQGLEQIKKHADRMSEIIQNVRSYIYRNEDETEDFISIKEIVDDVLMFCGQRLKNHGVELRCHGLDNVFVSGNKGQLEQALMNMINNSFDAIDELEEKWIEISAKTSGEAVTVTVRDSGHGIPAEVQQRMLEPFYSTKKNGKGSGLGLPLVKDIVEKHGGAITYVDGPHTTFCLKLPKASTMNYQH